MDPLCRVCGKELFPPLESPSLGICRVCMSRESHEWWKKSSPEEKARAFSDLGDYLEKSGNIEYAKAKREWETQKMVREIHEKLFKKSE